MTINVEYKYDKDSGIMHKIHHGKISIETIKNSWEWAYLNKIIPEKTTKFILDYRDAILDLEPRQSDEISNYYAQNPQFFAGKKFAIVSTNPHNIVISTLVRKKETSSKPFSTIEAAINWLNQ